MACFGALCGHGRAHQNDRTSSKKESHWRIFALKELQAATNNFNYDNKVGEGVFGSVYWGQLWDASQIAVKRLKVWSAKAEMDFSVQVELLGRIRHKNLLSLRGYCAEGQERLIVYEYMSNMSLYSHLHGQHALENLLDWPARMKIAIGAAEGISYLHHFATPRIIHNDIKASNVLLDSYFEARVADFGFIKLIPEAANHVNANGKGIVSYRALECDTLGKVSEVCDVYSFGILLLELLSGRRPMQREANGVRRSIVDWMASLFAEGRIEEIIDPRFEGRYNEEEVMRVFHVARSCVQHEPDKRPTMLEVAALLKGN